MSEKENIPEFRDESVSAERMRTLTALLRDPTPIHFDPEAVTALGMGDRVINQGPANVGYVLNALINAFPDRRLASFEVNFLDNVRAGDDVTAGGEIQSESDEAVDLEVWLEVKDGNRSLQGNARLVPRPDRD